MNTKTFLLGALGTVALTACSGLDETPAPVQHTNVTSIASAGNRFSTRFNNESGKWEKGDAIGVYMYNSDNSAPYDAASNVQYVTDEEAAQVSFKSAVGIPMAAETMNFYGYYPYSSTLDESGPTFTLNVADQSRGVAGADLMWAKKTGVTADDLKQSGLSLNFTHQLALVKIHVTTAQGLGDVEAVTVGGLNTAGAFNLVTGELSADAVPGIIQPYKLADNTFEAVVFPTKTPQNMTLSLYAGGQKYQYAMSSQTITEFKAGYRYLFNIGIGASVHGNLTEILGGTTPWGNETVEQGSAGQVESGIPADYKPVPVTSSTDLTQALQDLSGKVALVFDGKVAYRAFTGVQVPASVTGLLLVGQGDVAPKVQLADLTFGGTLHDLTFDNLELAGDNASYICAPTSVLADGGAFLLKNCHVHDVKSVYSNAGGDYATALASFSVQNSRIEHVGSIFNLHNAAGIKVENSTLYDVADRAFYPAAGTVSFVVDHCTIVRSGQTCFEAKGRNGSIDYTNNISDIAAKNICYGVTPAKVENNYAVAGSCAQLSGKATEGIDSSKSADAIFTNSGTEGDFTTALDAGDPRWRNK